MVTAESNDGITLRDVILHMQHMEQRLTKKIDANTREIREFKVTFTKRMDAFEEDLIVTIKDTVAIKKFVGMPLPAED